MLRRLALDRIISYIIMSVRVITKSIKDINISWSALNENCCIKAEENCHLSDDVLSLINDNTTNLFAPSADVITCLMEIGRNCKSLLKLPASARRSIRVLWLRFKITFLTARDILQL